MMPMDAFGFFLPTRLVFGERSLHRAAADLAACGQRALIVTGAGGSASRNGSLPELLDLMQKQGQTYSIYN